MTLVIVLVTAGLAAATWTPQTSGVTARLRGVSAISDRVAWASGASGTILRTADGGRTWQRLSIPGSEKLDFRDVDAATDRLAWALSIGPGESSRIYRTADAGAHWDEQFVNHDPKAFFDAMAFWDARRGIAVSDSVDGRFVIVKTADGGRTWTPIPADSLPPALTNEGAFAGSGTNVAVLAPNHVWIGTGAATRSRVLRSRDGGNTWAVADTPVASSASAGIFSMAFRDPLHGIVVGGDYRKESEAGNNAAITADGGATWAPVTGLGGFRSVVAYVPRSHSAIAVGPSGTDVSVDDGKTWTVVQGDGFHAFAIAPSGTRAWGVGEAGRIGLLTISGLASAAWRRQTVH